MSDFLTNKSKIIESDLIVHILSFCYKHYNDNHLFNDIMHVINSEFCYNLYLSSNIDAAIINNLREVIDYDRLKTILLGSFNLYCEYNRELKPFTISEVFDFQFFSMDDLKKTIIMNEIIYHYNLENELIEIISSTKDINPNIASSILFLINNYEVFSLKYLNIVRKGETYKKEQGKYTIIWFNVLVDTKHIENLLESSDDIEKNEDEYIKYRLLNNIFYDPDFLEHLIHYVGLYSKEVCDEFDKIISSRKSEDEVFFSNSSIMIKILELMLASQNLYHDYSRVLIKYVIDNKNEFLNNIYNHFITDEVVLLKYLKLCLKLCLKHNLKSEMSLIIESFKTIFFVNDSELIDIILKSKDLLLTQNLEQLQYIHFLMKSYIEMNLNINKLVDFDEISFRELLLKKISENQSMATRVIEYYLPLHENDEYCKKILGELNTYFFTSTKGLEEKSLINLLIISIHLINRLLEESYCGMILKEDNFTEKHFSLDNNDIYKY